MHLPNFKGQTFWSEGSANTNKLMLTSKKNLFKIERNSDPSVDDECNKNGQRHDSLLWGFNFRNIYHIRINIELYKFKCHGI